MADAAHRKSGQLTHQLVRVLDPNELVGEHLDMPGAAPSPIRNALALTICGALVVGLMASLIFSVDIYAVASAKVQPTGRSKILQAATAGRVSAVHVSNGSKVEAGQVLVEMDATETAADHAIVLAGVQAKDAEIARRTAALRLAAAMPGGGPRRTEFSADAPDDIMTREREVLKADLAQLNAGLAVLESRVAELEQTRDGLTRAVEDDDRLIALLQEQAGIKQELQAKGLETRLSLLDAQAALERARALRTSRQSEITKADASMGALRAQQQDLLAKFIAENTQARTQALEKRDEMSKGLIKAADKVGKTKLLAPIAGTIQELALTTPGQVIASGEQLMVVVPREASLEVEAMVGNRDIGFVKEGQVARVKLDTFPFAKYGVVPGRIERVSHDAVDQSSTTNGRNAGARPANPLQSGAAPVPQTTNLVYPVTILLDRDFIRVGDQDVRLSPGMTATVEIMTGRRRVIEYLLSPLVKTVTSAGHER